MKTVGKMLWTVLIFAALFTSCELPFDQQGEGNYTVVFHANGGSGKMAKTSFAYNKTCDLPLNTFTRDGYVFSSWATRDPNAPTDYTHYNSNQSSSEKYYKDGESIWNDSYNVKGTLHLYALWARTVTVRFDANGGAGEMADTVLREGGSSDGSIQSLPKNAFTRANYTFMGWATSPDGPRVYNDQAALGFDLNIKIYELEAGATITLYAVWSGGSYYIGYNPNGGIGNKYGVPFPFGEERALSKNLFTRSGYLFMGWATSPDGDVVYADGQSVVDLADTRDETVNLYAVWKSAYLVYFNANGGSGNMNNQYFAYGVPQDLPANTFTRSGYVFAGWARTTTATTAEYTDQQSFTLPVERAFELYAVWVLRGDAYYVHYDANGGSGTMTNSTFSIGESQNLPYYGFTRTGYAFQGWARTSAATTAEYANQQSVSNLTTAGQTVTLYAVWKANTYTVRYNANGGSGTMADSIFTYDQGQNLPKNTFIRTGYVFKGWAASQTATSPTYTDEQSVSNLATSGTVMLYAVWVRTYTVKYYVNNGIGIMDDSAFIYGEAQNLRDNTFTRPGYTFAGWSTSQTATSPTYTDGQRVSNLTTTAGGTVNLYAVWRNNYTVRYNANGGGGSMADSDFVWGVAQNLRANSFTRAGYTFAGWAESADGANKYSDGQSVSNLTTEANKIVNLYAVWGAGDYTVAYNANGGTAGTMASQTFTFGVAKELSKNTFTRNGGYTFAGWARSPNAAVQFTDEQSVNNLASNTGQTVTLYAVWNYTVMYVKDNDNAVGTMANSVLTYGVAQNLRPNAYTLTGYTFYNWCTTRVSNGPTTAWYSDGASVTSVKDVSSEADGLFRLYARWAPNTYTVKYDANGGSGGPMADTSFTYDSWQHLPQNAFTRYNYRFTGWARTSDATTAEFTDKQTANNLTATPNDTVTLYAVWSNTYTVVYDKNAADATGTMPDSTFTYGIGGPVPENQYKRAGYTLGGWRYPDGSPVYTTISASPTAGSPITLKAQWYVNYTIKFDKNAADATGTMSDQNFTYYKTQNLRPNAFKRANYAFDGWARSANGPKAYADEEGIYTLNNEPSPNQTITFYAVWKAGNYTVTYNANGGAGTMQDSSFPYDADRALPMNTFTRANYRFMGWATSANGAKAYDNGQTVRNLPTANETATLYAVWGNSYTVKYNANGGSGSMSDQNFTDGVAQNLNANNNITRQGYTFMGWARTSAATTAEFTNGQSVINLAAGAETVVNLYAVWNAHNYTVVYNANGDNVTGSMSAQSFTYGTAQNLRSNAFNRTNYTFAGWATLPDATTVQYTNGQNGANMNVANGATVNLYAVWRNHYTVVYHANNTGVTGTMNSQSFVYGTAQNLSKNNFTRSLSVFQGWAESADGVRKYDDEQSVSDLTTEAGGTVNLYALWASYYRIKYDANGGSGGPMADTLGNMGASVSLQANAFTRNNYRFLGWSTNPNATTATYTNGQSVNMTSTSGGTLYAIWSNTYTVKYNANGGTGTVADQTFTYGTSQSLSSNSFTRTNYTFAGWAASQTATSPVYTAGERVSSLTTVPNDTVNLYAVWYNNYTIVFNGNGSTSGSMSNQTIYGSGQLNANNYTRPNYVFAGWSTSQTATSVTYADKASVPTNLAAAGGQITLYAVWIAPYTVKYNANGGTGTMTDSTFVVNISQSLRANTFTRTGCVFIGWATSAVTLNSGTAAHQDGARVQNLAASGGTANLYAIWRTTYTVTYNANGGTGTMAAQNFTYGTSQTLSSNGFTRTGSRFVGWAISASNAADGRYTYRNGESVNNLTDTPGGTIPLWAVWD